jgi:hypothetical protein
MRILELLRRDGPATAASLREAVAKAEADAVVTSSRLTHLTQARAAALLDEDDGKLDQIEGELTQAQRHADRIDLAVAELNRRAEQAEKDERQARLDAIHARGAAAVRRGVDLICQDYAKHARALAAVAEELVRCRMEVDDVNAKLIAAGDRRHLPDLEREARPTTNVGIGQVLLGVTDYLKLPDPEHPDLYLYPWCDAAGVRRQPSAKATR